MLASRLRKVLIAIGALVVGLGVAATLGFAIEPVQEFVDALRQRGWHDHALEYLERSQTSPLVSDEDKKSIPYHEGVTLLDQARRVTGVAARDRALEQAGARLAQFIKADPQGQFAPKARNQLAEVLLDRGRTLVYRSESGESADKRLLQGEAREAFGEARQVLEEGEEYYVQSLKKLQKEGVKIEQRNLLRAELVSARLLIATVIYEEAHTFDAENKEFRSRMTDAAERYAELSEKYRKWLAGFYAQLWEGRCYQDLGKFDKAIGCYQSLYEDLVSSANEPAFRTLIVKATKLHVECLIQQDKLDLAIQTGRDRLDSVRGADRGGDWIAPKYQMALALRQKGQEVKQGSAEQRRYFREARILAKEVSRHPGEHQKVARRLIAELGPEGEPAKPNSFAAALEAGREAVDRMKTLKIGLEIAEKNETEAVGELRAQFEENLDAAVLYFQETLRLTDKESGQDNVNLALYYLCYLNWEMGHYYDAAVLGEFVARHYPESARALQCAMIVLSAYQKLHFEPNNPDPEFEADKLVEIADLITQRWPDQSESDDAYAILVSLALQRDDLDLARDCLGKMSPQRRRLAEVKVGLALWSKYLRSSRLDEQDRPSETELERLKLAAQEALENSFDLIKEGPVNESVATAALSLSQVYLDTGQYRRAIEVLENDKIGPLTLMANDHPIGRRQGFPEETYKSSLRAYVSVRPPEAEKADRIMDALDAYVSQQGSEEAEEKLTRIYIGLGRQLQMHLEQLAQEGKRDELERISTAFESFLDRVSHRQSGNDWVSSNWVAQTYFNLAEEWHKGETSSDQIRAYYENANSAYDRILQAVQTDANYAPSQSAVLGVQMRKAECLRRLRKFKEALNLFASVLAQKPNMLDAQIAAAYTYQERGKAQSPKWYTLAWQGGRKSKKSGENRIWGWAKLAQVAARYEQYHSVFYEARYNLALCRYKYALKQARNSRKKYLRLARNDIRFTSELYPKLGGDPWQSRFERLLKKIQKQMKSPQIGLKEFQDKPSSDADKTAKM